MSIGLVSSVVLGTAASALMTGQNPLSMIGDAFFSSPTMIANILIPDVLIEETNRDELDISRNPVEVGSEITDNSFLRQAEVALRIGWSNSGNYPGYVNDTYMTLLALQGSRQPFNLFTGTRLYYNMLFASVIRTVNPQFGPSCLMVHAILRQILIVQTASTQITTQAEAKNQAAPSRTNELTSGARQPKVPDAATQSALNTNTGPFNGVSAMTPPVVPDVPFTANIPSGGGVWI